MYCWIDWIKNVNLFTFQFPGVGIKPSSAFLGFPFQTVNYRMLEVVGTTFTGKWSSKCNTVSHCQAASSLQSQDLRSHLHHPLTFHLPKWASEAPIAQMSTLGQSQHWSTDRSSLRGLSSPVGADSRVKFLPAPSILFSFMSFSNIFLFPWDHPPCSHLTWES